MMDAIDVAGFSSEAALISQVRQRLARKYPNVPEARIAATVARAHAAFAHSRVRDFVPLLVERRARQELDDRLAGAVAAGAAAERVPSRVDFR